MINLAMSVIAQGSSGNGGSAIGAMIFFVLYLAIIVLYLAGMWKCYVKAGQPGWAAIVPIYNVYIWCKIVGRPWWWILLLLIPIVGWVVAIILVIDFAKSFGKSVLYGLGLAFLGLIFFPMLGFGKDQYQGPAAAK